MMKPVHVVYIGKRSIGIVQLMIALILFCTHTLTAIGMYPKWVALGQWEESTTYGP